MTLHLENGAEGVALCGADESGGGVIFATSTTVSIDETDCPACLRERLYALERGWQKVSALETAKTQANARDAAASRARTVAAERALAEARRRMSKRQRRAFDLGITQWALHLARDRANGPGHTFDALALVHYPKNRERWGPFYDAGREHANGARMQHIRRLVCPP